MNPAESRTDGAASAGPVRVFVGGDPLRAIAALWVVLLHVGTSTLWISGREAQWDSFGHWPGILVSAGGCGVLIFFVLSGYLISRPFIRAVQHADRLPQLWRYVAARALRIYPAFWAVLAIVVIVTGTHGASTGELIGAVTLVRFDGAGPFTAQLAPAWTLPIEVWFYALVPVLGALFAILTRRLRVERARLLVVVVPVAALWVVAVWAQSRLTTTSNLWFAAMGFAPGVLLAAFEPNAPRWALGPRAGRVWTAVAAAGLALLAVSPALTPWGTTWVWIAVTLAAPALVGGTLLRQRACGTCPRVLDNRVLRWLGQRSYGIYITHYLMISLTWKWALEPGAWKVTFARLALAVLFLTICAADLSWRWIEQPALRLRERIARPPTGDEAGDAPRDPDASVPAGVRTPVAVAG